MKKQIALLLSAALSAGVLAGCGSSNNPSDPTSSTTSSSTSAETQSITVDPNDPFHIVDEPVTFTFAAALNAMWGEAKDKQFYSDLEEQTNIHIEWNQFPSEVAAERVGVILSSSDMPDAFFGHSNFTLAQANTYGQQGLLIDLKPLIEQYAPNIKKAFDEFDAWEAYDAGNGAIYALPRFEIGYPASQSVYTELIINTEMLAQTGLDMPTTTDEFYEVLKAMKGMKTADGKDVIPFSYGPVYNYGDMLRGAFGVIDSTCGPAINDGMYLMYDGESFSPIANTDNYKEYIKFMNKLATEGLMDTEVYTQDSNTFNSKGQSGQLGSFVDYGGWAVVGQDKIESGLYDVVPVLAGPDGTKMTQMRYTTLRNACDFAITRDCEDPITLIKWLDLFYNQSLDVAFEAYFGPEGYNWEFNEEGILTKYPVPEEFNSYAEFRCSETIPSGPMCFGKENSPKNPASGTSLIKADLDKRGGYVEAATNPVMPLITFTDEENDELAVLRLDLIEYIKSFEASCIMGQKDVEAEWDKHLATLESLQMDRLVEIYNDALARYNAK